MLPAGISSRFPEARAPRRRARDPGVVEAVGLGGAGFIEGSMGGRVEGSGVRGRLFSGLGFFSLTGVCSEVFLRFWSASWCKLQAILMA